MSDTVQKWERERLRELARKQLEYAKSELNQKRIKECSLGQGQRRKLDLRSRSCNERNLQEPEWALSLVHERAFEASEIP